MAVDAVWSEPLSGCFSLLTGTFTGNSAVWAASPASQHPLTGSRLVSYELKAVNSEQRIIRP